MICKLILDFAEYLQKKPQTHRCLKARKTVWSKLWKSEGLKFEIQSQFIWLTSVQLPDSTASFLSTGGTADRRRKQKIPHRRLYSFALPLQESIRDVYFKMNYKDN